MISEPKWWRQDLLRVGRRLEGRYRQRRWVGRSLQAFEKEIFLGFFIVRKLIESRKVAEGLTHRNVPVTAYSLTDAQCERLKAQHFLTVFDAGGREEDAVHAEKAV